MPDDSKFVCKPEQPDGVVTKATVCLNREALQELNFGLTVNGQSVWPKPSAVQFAYLDASSSPQVMVATLWNMVTWWLMGNGQRMRLPKA